MEEEDMLCQPECQPSLYMSVVPTPHKWEKHQEEEEEEEECYLSVVRRSGSVNCEVILRSTRLFRSQI